MKTRFVSLAIFLVFVLFGFEKVSACSCLARTTCEFSATASAVFVGKVLDSKVEERAYRYSDNPQETPVQGKFQISRLEIREAFFGLGDEREVFVETDNFSSCFFSLEQGVEYVIYAQKDEKTGKFATGFCSGTKPVDSGNEDLRFLRAQNNTNGSTIKGFVALNAKNGEYLPALPPNNSETLLRSGISTVLLENGDNKFTAQIENDSTYHFTNVPKGKYKLSVPLPKGFATRFGYSPAVAKELGIELGAVELNGAGCVIENLTIVKTLTKKKRRK